MNNLEKHSTIEVYHSKKVLVVWYWWVIWTTIVAHLHSAWIQVTWVWKWKLRELWDNVIINWDEYELPEKHFEISKNTDYDYIFIATKLWDTREALEKIHSNWVKASSIIIVQNGLVASDYYEKYKRIYKNIETVAIFEALQFTYSNQISRLVSKQGWQIKQWAIWNDIATLLSNTWISCHPSEDVETQRARKFILNCMVNWISAIKKKTIRKLLEDDIAIIKKIFNECYEALCRESILTLRDSNYERVLALESLNNNFLDHFPSTYQDVMQSRKTEIDFLNGYIIELGKEYWIPTPMNQRVYDEVKKIEESYL